MTRSHLLSIGLILHIGCAAPEAVGPAEAESNLTTPTDKWAALQALISKGDPVQYSAAAALRPLPRADLDRLWKRIEEGQNGTAVRLMGIVGDSEDLTRLITILEASPEEFMKYRFSTVPTAVGLFAARGDSDGRRALDALMRCSQPSRWRTFLDLADHAAYSPALSCAGALALSRNDEARRNLVALSNAEHVEALGGSVRWSHIFRIEVLARAYYLDRLAKYEGPIWLVLEQSRNDDPDQKKYPEELGRAFKDLNLNLDDLPKD